MTARARRRTAAPFRTVLAFTFAHWRRQRPLVAGIVVAVFVQTMTDVLMPVRLLVDHYLAEHMRRGLTLEESAIAKLFATETLGKALDEMLQLHGGYGYMLEYPVARAYVDSRVNRIYGGASEVMRDLISRKL